MLPETADLLNPRLTATYLVPATRHIFVVVVIDSLIMLGLAHPLIPGLMLLAMLLGLTHS